MANAIRHFSLQIVSNPHFSQLLTLALALGVVAGIDAPIVGGGGGY